LTIFVFFWLSSSLATDPEYIELAEVPRLEVTASAGLALQTGYLTQENSIGSYSFGLNLGMPRGFVAFDWQGFRASHDTGEFPLGSKPVRVNAFSFVPQIRVYSKDAYSALVGIGLAQISLNQEDPTYSTDYGTFLLAGQLRYQWNSKWALQYKTSWFAVNQTLNDQKTSFEVWTHVLGVGYSL
jgi:hypothetical protein